MEDLGLEQTGSQGPSKTSGADSERVALLEAVNACSAVAELSTELWEQDNPWEPPTHVAFNPKHGRDIVDEGWSESDFQLSLLTDRDDATAMVAMLDALPTGTFVCWDAWAKGHVCYVRTYAGYDVTPPVAPQGGPTRTWAIAKSFVEFFGRTKERRAGETE